MKDMFQFFEAKTTPDLIAVDSDEGMLLEYIAEAASERDDDELGLMQFDPAVLATAIELPDHNSLEPKYKGMYVRYDSNCPEQHWGTEATVNMAVNLAQNWWTKNYTPTMLLGDISARNFSQTQCHSAHRAGTHLDLDLAGTLPRDAGYNLDKKKKCAIVCWIAIQLGVRRALFSDSDVAKAVNKAAQDRKLPGRVEVRADHDNHFHFEM